MKIFVLIRVLFLLLILAPEAHSEPSELIATCVACHGLDGRATRAEWPNLAGQKEGSMVTQLTGYRDGSRVNALMAASAQNLSDEEILAVSRYYAAQKPASQSVKSVSQAGLNVRARCISCHGVAGKTVNTEWPNLAGQNAVYLRSQLLAFRSGARTSVLMNVIAKGLSDEDIDNVSLYYSQIAP
jgi:cytochrome c553